MFNLTPWRSSGGGDLVNLRSELDTLFNRFFEWDLPLSKEGKKGFWAPRVDIAETDNQFTIKAEIPEVKKEDVKVMVDSGVLTIRGERKQVTMKNKSKKAPQHFFVRGFITLIMIGLVLGLHQLPAVAKAGTQGYPGSQNRSGPNKNQFR